MVEGVTHEQIQPVESQDRESYRVQQNTHNRNKRRLLRAGETAQRLRALVALAEDLDLVPRTDMMVHNNPYPKESLKGIRL